MISNKKLLVVVGPTSSGKTKLALSLAKVFGGEIVSADSRQIYKGMDIGTGKDLPKNGKWKLESGKYPFYEFEGKRIWGYDLVTPKENFSVAQYVDFAEKILRDIWDREKLPIIVGGTGLYIKGLIDGIDTISIAPNFRLRKDLDKKSVKELFEILNGIDPLKASSMNPSDKKNPRRLIRAIEIALNRSKYTAQSAQFFKADTLVVGLNAPKDFLNEKIERRVKQRMEDGFESEIEVLLKSGVNWNDQSMQSLGYRQYGDFCERKISREEFIKSWTKEEIKYAKRQMTWFKRDQRINWFDITESSLEENVENLVEKWYSKESYG